MMFRSLGFQAEERGRHIDNIPDTGTLTGNWGIDLYGCWWEYTLDTPEQSEIWGIRTTAWIIGDYPEDYAKYAL